MLLKHKVIIVTGAANGLGASIATNCVREGARVVLADFDRKNLQRMERKLQRAGARILAVPCDVRVLTDLQRLVTTAVKHFGRIDGLVNNAGVNFVKPFLETDEADWDHVTGVDLKGVYFLTQYCARQMIQQKPQGGVIVQVASVHTVASLRGAAPYDAAKHGVVGFSKAAALELASYGIRVNILSPGLCRTNIWDALVKSAPTKKACQDYWNSNIPGHRPIEPEEIADVTTFLLSNKSRSLIGSNVIADLGMTSQLASTEPYPSKNIT